MKKETSFKAVIVCLIVCQYLNVISLNSQHSMNTRIITPEHCLCRYSDIITSFYREYSGVPASYLLWP